MTSDNSNSLFFWNLIEDRLDLFTTIKQIKSSIFDIVGISYKKLMALATNDKSVVLVDFVNKSFVSMCVFATGVNSLQFCPILQVLMVAGFDNNI